MTRGLCAGETFRFGCHRQAPCFSECRRDLNRFLVPYDTLRLNRRPVLDSRIFLEMGLFKGGS